METDGPQTTGPDGQNCVPSAWPGAWMIFRITGIHHPSSPPWHYSDAQPPWAFVNIFAGPPPPGIAVFSTPGADRIIPLIHSRMDRTNKKDPSMRSWSLCLKISNFPTDPGRRMPSRKYSVRCQQAGGGITRSWPRQILRIGLIQSFCRPTDTFGTDGILRVPDLHPAIESGVVGSPGRKR